jgi:hypothetical protein
MRGTKKEGDKSPGAKYEDEGGVNSVEGTKKGSIKKLLQARTNFLVGKQIKLNRPFILSAEPFFKLMKFLTKKFLIHLLPLLAAHDILNPETHT